MEVTDGVEVGEVGRRQSGNNGFELVAGNRTYG